MTQEFDLINNVFGWGDPGNSYERGIWFVGIEEAEDWIKAARKKLPQESATSELSDEEVLEKARELVWQYHNRSKANNFVSVTEYTWGHSPVRSYTAKIVCRCSRTIQEEFGDYLHRSDQPEKKIWKNYQTNILWRAGSGVCNANLYPLGKPTTYKDRWPPLYEDLFGFGQNDIEKYKMEVGTNRFTKMWEQWEHCKPQATICYVGKTYQEDIEKVFRLRSTEWSPLDEDKGVLCQEEKHILLTSHFSRRPMRNLRAHVIEKQLARWNIKLPK